MEVSSKDAETKCWKWYNRHNMQQRSPVILQSGVAYMWHVLINFKSDIKASALISFVAYFKEFCNGNLRIKLNFSERELWKSMVITSDNQLYIKMIRVWKCWRTGYWWFQYKNSVEWEIYSEEKSLLALQMKLFVQKISSRLSSRHIKFKVPNIAVAVHMPHT